MIIIINEFSAARTYTYNMTLIFEPVFVFGPSIEFHTETTSFDTFFTRTLYNIMYILYIITY